MGPTAGCNEPPRPTDPAVVCPVPGDDAVSMFCALPEEVCVARGPRCVSYCVRSGQGCQSGTRIPPQFVDPMDGGAGTFCPYTDDVCCDAPGDLGVADLDARADGA